MSAIGGAANKVSSPVRGYVRGNGTHAAVYRNKDGPVDRVHGTPFNQLTALEGTVAQLAAPWGYVRDDGAEAVVYVAPDRRVHRDQARLEAANRRARATRNLDFSIAPINAPLAAAAPMNGPVPDVIPYRRADGQSALIYRSDSNHVIELLHQPVVPGG